MFNTNESFFKDESFLKAWEKQTEKKPDFAVKKRWCRCERLELRYVLADCILSVQNLTGSREVSENYFNTMKQFVNNNGK